MTIDKEILDIQLQINDLRKGGESTIICNSFTAEYIRMNFANGDKNQGYFGRAIIIDDSLEPGQILVGEPLGIKGE